MKRIISILAVVCCAVACVGQKEDMISQALTLKPDRLSADIDGIVPVTFSVTDGGVNVTSAAEIWEMVSGEPAVRLDNTTFTPSEAGTYYFAAKHNEMFSAQVKIDAYSSAECKSEGHDFFRRHIVLDFTGTWCVNCPRMAEAVHQASQTGEFYDRMIDVAVHWTDEFMIKEGEALVDKWNYKQLPYVVVDMDKSTEVNGKQTQSEFIMTGLRKTGGYFAHPCGVKVSTCVEGESLNVDAEVTITETGSYNICALLLRDGVVAPQKNGAENYVHSSILIGSLSGAIDSGVALGDGELSAGSVVNHSFSCELSKIEDFENTRVVVYVMQSHNGVNVVNNATQCPVGSSVEYRYE